MPVVNVTLYLLVCKSEPFDCTIFVKETMFELDNVYLFERLKLKLSLFAKVFSDALYENLEKTIKDEAISIDTIIISNIKEGKFSVFKLNTLLIFFDTLQIHQL